MEAERPVLTVDCLSVADPGSQLPFIPKCRLFFFSWLETGAGSCTASGDPVGFQVLDLVEDANCLCETPFHVPLPCVS